MSSKNSSNSSSHGGPGNVMTGPEKQSSPAKNWTMRWSNYPEDWKEKIVPDFHSCDCVGYVIGEEICPTTGTPHLQGYAEFKEKIRWSAFKNLPKGIRWKARVPKATRADNVRYCSKDGKFISWGTCMPKKEYKIDIELRPWQEDIVDVIQGEPNDRHVYWYWERTGNVGKTLIQKWIFMNYKHRGVAILAGKASDMKNGIVKFEEANKMLPEIVIINIPRCTDVDHVSWQGIEEIKDMFFFSPKYEGGMVCGASPHMLIFANEPPPLYKLSEDRWIVTEIS